MALVEMSRGRLTLDAIYQHGRELRNPPGRAPEADRREHSQP
jgi:hypothetical protein